MAEIKGEASERVESVLKATVEGNLARERSINSIVDRFPGAAYFSNGIIFSKSGNGTPFSNGIIFSKTGRMTSDISDPVQQDVINQITAFDDESFNAFTDRLLRLKEAKDFGRTARGS